MFPHLCFRKGSNLLCTFDLLIKKKHPPPKQRLIPPRVLLKSLRLLQTPNLQYSNEAPLPFLPAALCLRITAQQPALLGGWWVGESRVGVGALPAFQGGSCDSCVPITQKAALRGTPVSSPALIPASSFPTRRGGPPLACSVLKETAAVV